MILYQVGKLKVIINPSLKGKIQEINLKATSGKFISFWFPGKCIDILIQSVFRVQKKLPFSASENELKNQ